MIRACKTLLLGMPMMAVLPCLTAAQEVWQAVGDPAVTITDVDENGDLVLERPIGATRFRDGTIAVADAGSGTVLIFDELGRLRRRVGGHGEGPGEFRLIWWMGRCDPDSVLVWDLALRRMTVIGSDGVIGRQYSFPESGRAPPPFELACSRQGRVAYQAIPRRQERLGVGAVVRGHSPVFVVDGDQGSPTPLVNVAGPEMVELDGAGAPRPLGKRTSLAVWTDRVFVATADSPWVMSYQADRGLLTALPVATTSRAATEDDQAAAVARMLNRYPSGGGRAAEEALLAVPTPATLPPYNEILLDDNGTVWAVLPTWGQGVTVLRSVASGDGTSYVELRIPLAMSIFEVGSGYVIGLITGPLNVPRIALLHLERRTSRSGN